MEFEVLILESDQGGSDHVYVMDHNGHYPSSGQVLNEALEQIKWFAESHPHEMLILGFRQSDINTT
jgi:hypothetical protein